jgi:hypothetical protein
MSQPFNFTVNTSADAIKESSGGSFISKSGVYPITVNFVSIGQTKNGAYDFTVNFNYNGNTQTVYGPIIQNKDGSINEIGARVLNKLCAIAGLETGKPLDLNEEDHTVGKDNEVKTFIVATDLSGLECQMQVKEVFDKYKGEVKRSLDPINFFTSDGATADELVAKADGKDVTFGTQLSKILEAESTTAHRLGKDENGVSVTEEEVQAFLAAKKSGTKPAASTPAPAAPKRNLFASK